MLCRVAFGLGLAACLAACGPEQPGAQPALALLGQSIINGEPDANPAHQAVAYLSLELEEGGAACSGTLISPRVVLTAAHCVEGVIRIDVRFSSSGYVGPQIAASEWLAHPSYNNRTLSNDIALVRLSEPAPEGVVPIPYLTRELALTQADLGVELEFVGFGIDEAGIGGTRETVRNQLEWLCDRDRTCYFSGQGMQVWAASYTLCHDMTPGGPCSGDSGGPAFLFRGGQEYVVGVTSYGGPDCTSYGCSTVVDRFQSFIEPFLGLPDGSPCDASSKCGSGFCADDFCCDLECGSRCLRCDLPGSEGRCSPLEDGADCSDGNACNGAEVCLAGGCEAGTPPVCADEIACTRDLCDPELGCVFRPSEEDCWDGNACTQDTCDPQAGCTNPPAEDGTPCELGKVCRSARCVSESSGCASAGPGGLGLLALAFGLLRYRRR